MTVIYLFVSPSGRAYAGRHTCQHEGWPRRGSGALPSGYRGSGKLWANVTRRHGSAIRWIILRRFGPDAARADIDAAERRAVRLARAMWGERCMNLREGGEGFTSTDAHALWADPACAAKITASNKEAANRPEARARLSATAKAAMADPEARARQTASNKEVSNRPEVKAKVSAASKAAWADPAYAAKISAASKAHAQTPAGRAHLAAIRPSAHTPETKEKIRDANKARALTPERRAFLAAIRASSSTPEAIAKMLATRARNKALREARA